MKLALMLAMLALVLGVAGCISARRGEPVAGPLRTDDAAARGRVLYARFCDQCHPGGDAGLGPALNNKPLPGFMIKTQVRAGMGVMPKFPERVINAEQLDDVVAYIKAQRKRGA